jgi:hypothetical protein
LSASEPIIFQIFEKVPGSSRGGAIRREPADLAERPDEAEVTVKIKEQVVGPSGDLLGRCFI